MILLYIFVIKLMLIKAGKCFQYVFNMEHGGVNYIIDISRMLMQVQMECLDMRKTMHNLQLDLKELHVLVQIMQIAILE